MACFPVYSPPATWQPAPAPRLVGPFEQRIQGPCFLALEAPTGELAMVLAGLARLLDEQRAIYCADGCNRFDPYRFSEWARRSGLDPDEVLRRVFVSRAFTIHQLAALVAELPVMLPPREPRPLVVILGIEAMFLDEQLPRFEREHLFTGMLKNLRTLRAAGLSLLTTIGPPSSEPGVPSSAPWAARLNRAADHSARMRRLADGAFAFEVQGSALFELPMTSYK